MKVSITDRIKQAFADNGDRRMEYRHLAVCVFPEDDYPNAWRYSVNGGPPGCYMALSAAIRRMELPEEINSAGRWVYPPRLSRLRASQQEGGDDSEKN